MINPQNLKNTRFLNMFHIRFKNSVLKLNSETRKLNLPSDKISIHFTCSRVDLELGEILANEHGIGSNDRKNLYIQTSNIIMR